MATITTGGSGNWSSTTPNAPWPGGTLPTNADDVVVAKNHTVTLDTTAVAKSVTLNAGTVGGDFGAVLQASNSANSTLTVENGILVSQYSPYVDSRNSQLSVDMSADGTKSCTIVLNNGLTSTTSSTYGITMNGELNLKGVTRNRWAATTAGMTGGTTTTVDIDDATGWQVGDRLIFASTNPCWQVGTSVLGQAITNVTNDGTYTTFTSSSAVDTILRKGSQVYLLALQSALSGSLGYGGNWEVYDVPSTYTFRIANGALTITDTVGVFNATPDTDEVTIATITAVGGGAYSGTGAATVTWTTGRGAGGSVAHDHLNGCIVGNFTSNVTITSANSSYPASLQGTYNSCRSAWASSVIENVAFSQLRTITFVYQWHSFSSISNNAFYDFSGNSGVDALYFLNINNANNGAYPTRSNNVHWHKPAGYGASVSYYGYYSMGPETDLVIMRCHPYAFGLGAVIMNAPGLSLIRPKISGVVPISQTPSADCIAVGSIGQTVTDGDFWSTFTVTGSSSATGTKPVTFNNCTFGTKYSGATNTFVLGGGTGTMADNQVTFNSCTINGTLVSGTSGMGGSSFIDLLNKNNNTSDQERYTLQSKTVPAIQRSYASPQSFTRSTSSALFTSSVGTAITLSENILAANNVPITVTGYMVTSHYPVAYGSSTLPSISLSGLGITPSTDTYVDVSTGAANLAATNSNTYTRASGSFITDGFVVGDSILAENFSTAGNNGTKTVIGVTATVLTVAETLSTEAAPGTNTRAITRWYKASITGTQSSGADGNLTLTLTSQSATSGAKAWFSGIPISPFVSRARHFGYLFDETVPTRTQNQTVTCDFTSKATISSSEATAQALTGISVAWGSPSPVTITDNTTFQNLYDYTQAWACRNVASSVPLTGAGVAGSPSLFAAANLTINTTKVLNGSGSISMGAYTLTSEFASGANPAYTYTGGTWSQATTVPTFTGGTLAMAGEGTYTFTASSPIITFAPTANAVTYNLAGGTFTGTLDLRNTHGTRTITVQLPAGTSYTTANNTGATITVSLPAVYQSVTVSGATAGSRIQIYDNTSATELYNGTPTFPYTWTDSVAAAGDREIRLRVAYCTASTANIFIDTVIGTCGTTEPSNAVSYLVSPVVDSVYVANLIDGTTITDCSITGSNLNVDIDAGSVTWQHIYAFMVYWLSTSGGIRDQYLEMTATDQTHYVFATAHGSFKIKNVTSPSTPLLVTGGNAAPDSGPVTNILDTTGGSIFCIEGTVVPFTTSSQAVNQATVEAGVVAQANALADALLDRTDAVETGLTPRKALRLQSAVLGGKLSGGGTTTNVMRNAVADTKVRVTATVDSDGNRTAITTDLT